MPIRRTVTQLSAGLAAVTLVVGAGVFGRAVVATQGWWYSGFVSETGEPGAPHRDGYVYGILGLGAALLLLALALTLAGDTLGGDLLRWVPWSAAALLAGGGLLAWVSSLVSCSVGCPLPPYETPTPGDLVHASSSVLGMAACGAAMAVFAVGPREGVLRGISRGWLVVVVPLFAVAGLSLLLLGRSYATGSVEKVLVVVICVWVLVASLRLALTDT